MSITTTDQQLLDKIKKCLELRAIPANQVTALTANSQGIEFDFNNETYQMMLHKTIPRHKRRI